MEGPAKAVDTCQPDATIEECMRSFEAELNTRDRAFLDHITASVGAELEAMPFAGRPRFHHDDGDETDTSSDSDVGRIMAGRPTRGGGSTFRVVKDVLRYTPTHPRLFEHVLVTIGPMVATSSATISGKSRSRIVDILIGLQDQILRTGQPVPDVCGWLVDISTDYAECMHLDRSGRCGFACEQRHDTHTGWMRGRVRNIARLPFAGSDYHISDTTYRISGDPMSLTPPRLLNSVSISGGPRVMPQVRRVLSNTIGLRSLEIRQRFHPEDRMDVYDMSPHLTEILKLVETQPLDTLRLVNHRMLPRDATALARLANIRTLDLVHTGIPVVFPKHEPPLPVKPGFVESPLTVDFSVLVNLHTVSISNYGRFDTGSLNGHARLHTLDMRNIEEDVRIPNIPMLHTLKLSNVHSPGIEAAIVAHTPNLHSLHLVDIRAATIEWETLSNLSILHSLHLSSIAVTPDEANVISTFPSLQHLELINVTTEAEFPDIPSVVIDGHTRGHAGGPR